MHHAAKITGSRTWARYASAACASLLAIALDLAAERAASGRPGFFFAAFAAAVGASAWAGFGPGLLASLLSSASGAVLLRGEGASGPVVVIRCALFLADSIFLNVLCSRLRKGTLESRQSEEWHRGLIDTSNEAIWIIDSNGAITYANPRVAEILGRRSEEIVGKSAEEFFFPADLPMERVRFQNRRSGQREQFDRRLRRKDGAEAWVLAVCSSFPGRPAEPNGVLAMMTDITERKRAEQALRRSEARFRGLFENVLEGVYQSTPEGKIVAANPMLLNMLGLVSESELNDVNIARDLYLDPDVRKRLLERLEREGAFRNVEYQLRRRDGKTITVRENARAVRDDEGRVAYYEGTLSDVTELIHIESELVRARNRETLEAVATGLPHEFRNFLTVIYGYSKLLLDEIPASHRAYGSALNILNAVENASDLTDQLAAFSGDADKTVDINRAVLVAHGSLKKPADEPLARLCLAPWSLPVHAAGAELGLLIQDLLRGARELSLGAVRFDNRSINERPGARPGLYARIAAKGIETDVLARHELIANCGGFVLREDDGAGVYLPISQESAHLVLARLSEQSPRETILLLQEEPLIREVTRDLLERQGYCVILAADVGEAEKIENHGHRFDLLIADLRDPHAGAELARRFRGSRPEMKALLISPKGEHRIRSAWQGAWLERPFSAEALNDEIRRMFGR